MSDRRECYLRRVEEKDVDLIFSWANDPDVRKNSFSTARIPYKEHVEWFKRMLSRRDTGQYIMIVDGIDVGQIRVMVENESAEIGYSIASEYRGMGYGKGILSLVPDIVKRDFPNVKKLVAKVKTDNVASQKAFLDNHYLEKCLVYELELEDAGKPHCCAELSGG